jgi:hypothetical protein
MNQSYRSLKFLIEIEAEIESFHISFLDDNFSFNFHTNLGAACQLLFNYCGWIFNLVIKAI